MELINQRSSKTPCYPNFSSVWYSAIGKYMIYDKILKAEFRILLTIDTQPLMQRLLGAPSPGVERLGREADHYLQVVLTYLLTELSPC
jgi:hypothetical protein